MQGQLHFVPSTLRFAFSGRGTQGSRHSGGPRAGLRAAPTKGNELGGQPQQGQLKLGTQRGSPYETASYAGIAAAGSVRWSPTPRR